MNKLYQSRNKINIKKKQNEIRLIDTKDKMMIARWGVGWVSGLGEKGKEIKKCKLVVMK